MICPYCSLPVDDGANCCPNCGATLSREPDGSPYAQAASAAAGGGASAAAGVSGAAGAAGGWSSGGAAAAQRPNQAGSSRQQGFWETAQQTQWAQQQPTPGAAGYAPRAEPVQPPTPPYSAYAAEQKSKVVAGILAIFLGSLGIHKFYLGYAREGVIMLLVTLLTLGVGGFVMEMIGIIEGIIYLTKSDYDFYRTYVLNRKPWF